MRAKSLKDLLKARDRVAVSNITGREAAKVSIVSQRFCGNIVAGWALGKAGQALNVPGVGSIPVFGQFDELMTSLPEKKRPNKIVVYSPPDAVYGDVKEVLEHGQKKVETIFVITEHVSIEVTAKLKALTEQAGVDIVGCNTLGVINPHESARVGAIGADAPDETFRKGSVCILSNSGNMVNTIAAYLQAAGLGISCGISTGKDVLILTPSRDLLPLAMKDPRTRIIALYIEPGGAYEQEAIEYLATVRKPKPILVYVSGRFAEGRAVLLGHAGAVVEGPNTSASRKIQLFDDYFGMPVFDPEQRRRFVSLLAEKKRGVRVNTLHDLVPAAQALIDALDIKPDFQATRPIALRPWFVELGALGRKLPRELALYPTTIPEPYGSLVNQHVKSGIGRLPTRQPMRNASHASSNDGITPRIYGYSVMNLMKKGAFGEAVLLYWLGHPAKQGFEARLFEMGLIASLTNGPGTISAQGPKLSASAGNSPNTAMIATLAAIGTVHGGNGQEAARMLVDLFGQTKMTDPYSRTDVPDLDALVNAFVNKFKEKKAVAKEAGLDYGKVPCLGHPVFNKETINYDPRERVIAAYMEQHKLYNVFHDFYHRLARAMMDSGVTNKVHAVNVDAALTCILMGMAWPLLKDKKITVERAVDLPFLAFALGRVAGGAGEYLDHRESGADMDMRVPVEECRYLGRILD
ncbi:MAG: citrate/2-methylcitrate synthase [Verrucomicrobiota bacterium]|nr:citrate/2-methylcitrate synthase [Verrucomicrobiota bacterium]